MKSLKSLVFFSLLVAFSINVSAQELLKDMLQDTSRKSIDIKSIKINDSTSLHYVIYKSKTTKQYILQPYFIGENVKKLLSFSFEKKPTIISNHFIDDKWVLTYKLKRNINVFVREYNFNTQKTSQPKLVKILKYNHLITTKFNTYFLTFVSNKKIELTVIKDINTIYTKNLSSFDKDTEYQFTVIHDKLFSNTKITLDNINTNEYIEVGSLSKGHSYVYDNTILLTFDNKKNKTSYVVQIKNINTPDDYTFTITKYVNGLTTTKQIRSFAAKDKLFQFALNYDKAKINIYDLSTHEILKNFDYTKENFGPYNTYFYKNIESSPNSKKFFRGFRNMSAITDYKPTIFIVVNENISGGYVLESGHINSAVYHYHQDPFMFMNKPYFSPLHIPNFGPNINYDYNYFPSEEDELKKTSFILSLNKELQRIKTIPETKFTKINNEKEE